MSDRDLVTRWIAANRFPFPDQADWPKDYVTITNVDGPIRGVTLSEIVLYPDIVIVDGPTQRIAELGVIVDAIPADAQDRWAAFSEACKPSSTGVRSFFVYAPVGLESQVRRVLDEYAISYAGVRTYSLDADVVEISPVVTPGDAKDHR